MRFIATEISPQASVSLMSQYLPLWSARRDPLLGRPISPTEYHQALEALRGNGLARGWTQALADDPPDRKRIDKNHSIC